MCVYCMMGDEAFRWNPPWDIRRITYPGPAIPAPVIPTNPIKPWGLEQLREYRDLLREIKELEDKVGCPCPEEREKPDYVGLFSKRISDLERMRAEIVRPINPEGDGDGA